MRRFYNDDIYPLIKAQLDDMELAIVKTGICNETPFERCAASDEYLLYDTDKDELVTNPIDEETGEYRGYRKYDYVTNNTLKHTLNDEGYINRLTEYLDGIIQSRGLGDALAALKENCGNNAYSIIYDQLSEQGVVLGRYETIKFKHMELLTAQKDCLDRIDLDLLYDEFYPNLTRVRDEQRGDDSDVDKAFDDALSVAQCSLGQVEGAYRKWVVRDNKDDNGIVMDEKGKPRVYEDPVALVRDSIERRLKEQIIIAVTSELGNGAVDRLMPRDVHHYFNINNDVDLIPNYALLRLVDDLGDEVKEDRVAAFEKTAGLAVALGDLTRFADCIAMNDHISFTYLLQPEATKDIGKVGSKGKNNIER